MSRTGYVFRLIAGAVIGMTALILGACAPASQPATETATAATSDQTAKAPTAPAGSAMTHKSLTVRFYDDPSGFDPATLFRIETENIAFNIYSGLTSYEGATGKIVPDLAESWATSDQKTWTFSLRKGVQWQKGYGELTSADVLYSYNRIMNAATASPYRAEFNNIDKVEAPDPYTVVITLKKPDAGFLHQVANYHQGQIVKKEAVEKAGDQYKWNPVGTGPFVLEKFTPGSEIVLARHEGYYKGPAPLERINFRIVKDDKTAAIALQNKEVDLAMRVGQQTALESLMKDKALTMNIGKETGIALKVFNPEVAPLADARVRQAWAHAVDWAAIYKTTAPLTSSAFYNLLPSWMDGYTADIPLYPYDVEKAKKLLADAGYAKGFTVKQLGASSAGISEANQLEKSYLAAVGINLEFELVDTPVFNQRRNQGAFEVSGRLLPAINPDTILFSYLHPDNTAPKGLNGARYNNPEMTALLESARAEGDPARRKELYAKIQRVALTDLSYLPTLASHVYWPGYSWVTGVVITPLAQVNFYGVDIQPH